MKKDQHHFASGGKPIKERPIIFSAPMVRAILDGTKTQTRRIVKPQPPIGHKFVGHLKASIDKIDEGKALWGTGKYPHIDGLHKVRPPFENGGRLWVRETWQHSNYPFGPLDDDCSIFYRADYFDDRHGHDGEKSQNGKYRKWLPSIHMPRWASRILLEITNVRVERLQDISEADCKAEGVRPLPLQEHSDSPWWTGNVEAGSELHSRSALGAFEKLWNSINGSGSWDANPWVWVIEFKVISNVAP